MWHRTIGGCCDAATALTRSLPLHFTPLGTSPHCDFGVLVCVCVFAASSWLGGSFLIFVWACFRCSQRHNVGWIEPGITCPAWCGTWKETCTRSASDSTLIPPLLFGPLHYSLPLPLFFLHLWCFSLHSTSDFGADNSFGISCLPLLNLLSHLPLSSCSCHLFLLAAFVDSFHIHLPWLLVSLALAPLAMFNQDWFLVSFSLTSGKVGCFRLVPNWTRSWIKWSLFCSNISLPIPPA